MSAPACPVCGEGRFQPLADLDGLPVFCNVPCTSPMQALAVPRGRVDLVFCPACGHVHNPAFDPALLDYSPAYDASLQASAVFRRYARDLAGYLGGRYGLEGGRVVEIGCGDGAFLRLLCEVAGCRGIGFDPAYPGTPGAEGAVTFVREGFTPAHLDGPVDLIVCRHVLEHLPRPAELVAALAGAGAGRLFFEVPNALRTLNGSGVWDVIYEHVSYFTPASLAALFARNGFAVEAVRESYGGQFLCIEARLGAPASAALPALEDAAVLAGRFPALFQGLVQGWRARLAELAGQGAVVAWGAGSKGVTFLNLVDGGPSRRIAAVTDLNPRKQGMFVPGTGHAIVAPADLWAVAPRHILVMNPIYRAEIGEEAARAGLSAAVVTLDDGLAAPCPS